MTVLALKTGKKTAQKVHGFLVEKGLLSKNFRPVTEGLCVFFPLGKKLPAIDLQKIKTFDPQASVKKKQMQKKQSKHVTLKEALKEKLSKKELALAGRAFDLVGNIAIVEIPKGLEKKEKLIGEALLETQKGVETVCKKTGAHKGIFRVEPVKVIAGKKNTVATYRESGCIFRVSLGKVFFSPRLGSERLRIAHAVKKPETVGVLFAGVGPFAIVLAKNSPVEKVFGVELNPHAVKDMAENIKLNRCEGKVEPILGDVKKIVPKLLAGKCDRVLMPLPKGAEDFLPEAFLCLKPKGGIIHFYGFAQKTSPFVGFVQKVRKVAKGVGRKIKVLHKQHLRDYSPDMIQVVIDFLVE